MKKEENLIYKDVFDNAIDFLTLAANELWNKKINRIKRAKFSAVHFYQGLELFLKSYIIQKDWRLAVIKPDDCTYSLFIKGDFKSIGFEDTLNVLKFKCKVCVTKSASDSFYRIKKLRNKFIHFKCSIPDSTIVSTQLSAWHYMLGLIETNKFTKFTNEELHKIDMLKRKMLRYRRFINARYKEIKGKIKKMGNYRLFIKCPVCEKKTIYLREGNIGCVLCGYDNIDPESIAEVLLYGYKLDKVGHKRKKSDKIGYCGICGNLSVIPIANTPLEGVSGSYICINCRKGKYLKGFKCPSCGVMLFNLRENYCPICREEIL